MKTKCVILDQLRSEIPEGIAWRDRRAAEWGSQLAGAGDEVAPAGGTRFPNGELNRVPDGSLRKKDALKQAFNCQGFRAAMVGVLRNTEPEQAKERGFRPRTATWEASAEDRPPDMRNNSRRFPALAGWPVIQWRTQIQIHHKRIQS